MRRILFLIVLAIPVLAFAGQGMGPGPGVKGYGPTGNSDAFTGTQAALATHNAQWTAAVQGVANLEINGSGQCRLTGGYRAASTYYAASTSDISQIDAIGGSAQYFKVMVFVRMSASANGYGLQAYNADGAHWTLWYYKNGSSLCAANAEAPLTSGTHTFRLTASGSSGNVTLQAYVDGTPLANSCTDTTDQIYSGSPGFALDNGLIASYTTELVDNWQDY